MPPQNNSNQSTIIKVIAAVVVLGLAAFGFSRMDKTAEIANENADQPIANSGQAGTGQSYRNGSYSSTGRYVSPAGQEEVDVTLTLENDVVVAATFVGKATNPGSIKNQGLFKEGFEQYVVGKPIDSISLGVVNGSSLTPKGFMDALSKIKAEAKA